MNHAAMTLTGQERHFLEHELIVSKTDTKGRITYSNRVFQNLSGYSEKELMGKAHSIIRHPEMPRCVFKLLWDTIEGGHEIFAYVVNRARNGDSYWVFAHVTPSFDASGQIIAYHSNRRVPRRPAIDTIRPVYRQLLEIEQRHGQDVKAGIAASSAALAAFLKEKGVTYDELVFAL
jgi:PAS domain S-box-containing protein